ncbi:MurR/RpiR family transcriptional regulator [Pseudonocardia sp.]|uniref:MurR/RpiR family transcriptional regulator n=1 Tax=Pseudonocardia sp. TaxID=60912 RepID=UPI002B4B8B0B|nr:MurR/RpiR family transcriptional regulator [Pseudonocardia sp.]
MGDEGARVPAWVERRLAGREPGRGVAKVLRALAADPRRMSYASTAAAARAAQVNVATVVRAAQLLGFSGWPALRAEIRSRYLAGLSASQVLTEHATDDGPARATLRRELANLRDLSAVLDEEQIGRAARLLVDARVTLVLGSGSFAAPGLQLAHLAQTLGHDVRLQQVGGTGLLNAVSLLREGDCVVAMLLWRTPREVLDALGVARERGARVVVVSDRAGEPFSHLATELVQVPSEGAGMFPSVVAATTVVQAVVAAVVALDPAAARRASDGIQALWDRYGLFPDPDA